MRRFVAFFVFALLSAPVRATVLVPIEFRELVAVSPIILHGHVVDVRSDWIDGRRAIETIVTVEPAEYFKGDLGDRVTFKVPGGELGRYRTIFVGAPVFAQGDEVVLFLDGTGAAQPHVVGLSQGVFRVVPDRRSGLSLVIPPAVMGRTDVDAEPVVRGDIARKPVPLDTFRQAIRQVIAEGGR